MHNVSSIFENVPIKWRLFLLEAVLALLILGSIGTICLWQLQMSIESNQRDRLYAVASEIANVTDGNLHNAGEQLHRLAESNAIDDYYAHGNRQPLENEFLKREILFPEISLIGADGEEKVKVIAGKAVTTYKNYSRLGLLRLASSNSGHEVLGKPYYSINLNGAFVDMACQGCGNGKHPDLTLRASLSLDLLERAVSDIKVPSGGFFVLFDENGYILASSRQGYPMLRLSAAPVNDEIGSRELLDGKQYFGNYRFLNCDCVIAESSPSIRNLRAVVAMPFAAYQAPIYQLRQHILIIFLIAALVSMVAIAWVVKRFMAPITLITNAALDVAQNGALNRYVDWQAQDEIGVLAKSFNMMLSRLAQTHGELVNERNHLDKVLLSLADMLIITDGDGIITRANRASQSTLQYHDRNLEGMPIRTLFKEGNALISSITGELQQAGVVRNVEATMLTANRWELPVIFSVTAIEEGATQAASGLIFICKTIMENADSGAALRHPKEEVSATSDQLQDDESQLPESDAMAAHGKRPAAGS